jgi:FkbM family methyltransferase
MSVDLFDPGACLAAWCMSADDALRARVEAFFTPSNAGRRYLLGRNAEASALAARWPVAGFVDDWANGETWGGLPVIGSEDAPSGAILVNCALSQKPISAWRRIESRAGAVALNYADLLRIAPDDTPIPAFVADMRTDLATHAEAWRALFDGLADGVSRATLSAVMRYRLTGDPRFMLSQSWRARAQYFDSVLSHAPGAVMVDAGGFDGDTAEAFAQRCPHYGRIHVFEPSAHNMTKARARLSSYRDIVFEPRALSRETGVLRFNAGEGSASAASENGDALIPCAALDDCVNGRVSFIKMDIEGGEFEALKGARRTIATHHPALAIAVYHSAADFRRLPELILSIRPDYRLFLRHYSEGWAETVAYFAPV